MRVKRRRAHVAIWRTGDNQEAGHTDGRTDLSIALSPLTVQGGA